MSGHVGNLSDKQQETLDKFRDNVSDILKPDQDDYYCLRWLRARQFDIKKAESMLRNNMAWRERLGADTILDDLENIPALSKFFTGGFFGTAKNGVPIFVIPLGEVDVKGLNRSVRKYDRMRFQAYLAETMLKLCRENTEKSGHHIETFAVIMDLQNYGLRHITKTALEFQIELVQLFEDNYPETMDIAFLINAPSIFPIAYRIFSPFLSEDTRRKVKIMGHDYMDEVLKKIDPGQIPEYYGGTANDPPGDPKCSAKISYGGDVPAEYYRDIDTVERETWPFSIVKRGSTVQLDYTVTVPGSLLSWQFSTEHYDIGFGIYRRTSDKRQSVADMEVVVATDRVNSHLIPEEGHIVCDTADTYVLRFDNTYSWSKAKKVYHLIDVLTPNTDQDTEAMEKTSDSETTEESPDSEITEKSTDSEITEKSETIETMEAEVMEKYCDTTKADKNNTQPMQSADSKTMENLQPIMEKFETIEEKHSLSDYEMVGKNSSSSEEYVMMSKEDGDSAKYEFLNS